MGHYKNAIYKSYVSDHNKNLYGENSLEKIIDQFPVWNYYYAKLLPDNKNARILDVGCGDGSLLYWLQSLGYVCTFGIDISEEQVAAADRMGIKNVICSDLKSFLSDQTDCYDLIIARDVIEHFAKEEVFNILVSVYSNLLKGGKFLIQVPNGQGMFYSSIFYGDFTHETVFTSNSINQIALNAGFSSSSCYPVNPVPRGVFSRIRFVLWKYKELQLKFWKMVETGSPKGIFTQNLIAQLIK
jgi:SAM-dependent methyltransferase